MTHIPTVDFDPSLRDNPSVTLVEADGGDMRFMLAARRQPRRAPTIPPMRVRGPDVCRWPAYPPRVGGRAVSMSSLKGGEPKLSRPNSGGRQPASRGGHPLPSAAHAGGDDQRPGFSRAAVYGIASHMGGPPVEKPAA